MKHEHGSKLYTLEKGGETSFAKITYDRWFCTGCKAVTLVPRQALGHSEECVPDPKHPGYWICTEAGHPQSNHALDEVNELEPLVSLLEALPLTNERGFRYTEIPFRDYESTEPRNFQIQESSLATEHKLWLGPDTLEVGLQGPDAPPTIMNRVHVGEDTVRQIRDALTAWLEA